ncbi:MAG: outer membrane protein assembly factor BamC, partial [Burkholderiales bacterium]|nr:outer membrane protein assembly factor BamC [Burkholderiales bacterium]
PPVEGVRMERAGSQRWLVIKAPPEKVWPVVREFWQESGFIVQTESPDTGVLETDWAENRAKIPQDFIRRALGGIIDGMYSTSERDRFRTRLETTAEGTEVFISHRGLIEVFTNRQEDVTVWQPRPSDPELEAEFLRRLMLKFGVSSEQSQAAVTATAVDPNERAKLINTGTTQVLEVAESFDRAWRRVGLALDRGGFTVEDRDRSQGLYFVRYIDPEVEGGRVAQKPGFFARIFGSSKQRADAAQKFRIQVAGTAEQTRVNVLGGDGQPVGDVDRRTAGRILALLHEQLK